VLSCEFTYEKRRGRESNPRLFSSSYGVPFSS
jgi:hypothetical protein